MPRPPVVPLVRAVHVTRAPAVARALTLLQRRLTWATMAVYAAAALLPTAGLTMRQLSFGAVSVPGGTRTPLTLRSPLLAWLLFTAALRVPARDLLRLLRRPLPLLVGTLANTLRKRRAVRIGPEHENVDAAHRRRPHPFVHCWRSPPVGRTTARPLILPTCSSPYASGGSHAGTLWGAQGAGPLSIVRRMPARHPARPRRPVRGCGSRSAPCAARAPRCRRVVRRR